MDANIPGPFWEPEILSKAPISGIGDDHPGFQDQPLLASFAEVRSMLGSRQTEGLSQDRAFRGGEIEEDSFLLAA